MAKQIDRNNSSANPTCVQGRHSPPSFPSFSLADFTRGIGRLNFAGHSSLRVVKRLRAREGNALAFGSVRSQGPVTEENSRPASRPISKKSDFGVRGEMLILARTKKGAWRPNEVILIADVEFSGKSFPSFYFPSGRLFLVPRTSRSVGLWEEMYGIAGKRGRGRRRQRGRRSSRKPSGERAKSGSG